MTRKVNAKKTVRLHLALVGGMLAVGCASADTTYIWNRTSDAGAWNNAALWQYEDGTAASDFPNSTDAVVVFREDRYPKFPSLFVNNQHLYMTLKELRLVGCGGRWGEVSSAADDKIACTLTYMGVLSFSAGGGMSFPDLPAVSPQPFYYYLTTVPACQGEGEVVFDIPGNVEVNFDRNDILHRAVESGNPVLVKRGEGMLCIGQGGNRWNTSTAGAGKPEVPIRVEAGTARLVFATTSHDIDVPLTFAGDTARVLVDKRDNTRGGLGFGTGYLAETGALTGGRHSIESHCGSVLGFYGATAVETQTFSGCLAGNLQFEFKPTVASEFVFSNGVSTTTGPITVGGEGSVRVTGGASFPNVSSVTINTTNGRLVIDEEGAAAFPKANFSRYYGQIEVPEGRRVAIKSLTSWGSAVPPGVYKRTGSPLSEGTEATWVAGDGLVIVGSPAEAASVAATWSGAGADHFASTAANWSVAPQSLTDGSASVAVNVGGYKHFVSDSAVWVKGFTFNQPHFAIGAAEGEELRIGSGGLANPGNGEVVVGFASAPGEVVLTADQTWDPGSGHILIQGPVKALGGAKLTVSGKGSTQLRLSAATPDWNSPVLVQNMLIQFNASDAFGSSRGVPVSILHNGRDNSPTFANGVEVNRPLVIADRSVANGGRTKLVIPENATVTFNASVVSSNKTEFAIESGAGSRAVFNDLFMSRNNVWVSGSGTLVFNGPFHTNYRFYPNGFSGIIELHSTGNRFNGALGDYWTAGTIKTMVPYAFTAQNPRRVTSSSDATNNPVDADTRSLLYLKQNATLDLCGNDQILGDMHAALGGRITSATPATLYMDFTANVVTEYINANSKGGYKTRVEKAVYSGAVNYSKWGQLPRWFMADSTSTGVVEVAEGTLTFCSGTGVVNLTPESGTAYNYPDALARGSWPKASAVVVKGGKMVFEHSACVGRKTDVRFVKMNNTYGKLRLESGVRQRVRELYVDGVRQSLGTYGSSSASGAAHHLDSLFEGDGVLEVAGVPGLTIFVR